MGSNHLHFCNESQRSITSKQDKNTSNEISIALEMIKKCYNIEN